MSGAGAQAQATSGEAGTELRHARDAALVLPEALVDLHYEALPSSGRGARPLCLGQVMSPGCSHSTWQAYSHLSSPTLLPFVIDAYSYR